MEFDTLCGFALLLSLSVTPLFCDLQWLKIPKRIQVPSLCSSAPLSLWPCTTSPDVDAHQRDTLQSHSICVDVEADHFVERSHYTASNWFEMAAPCETGHFRSLRRKPKIPPSVWTVDAWKIYYFNAISGENFSSITFSWLNFLRQVFPKQLVFDGIIYVMFLIVKRIKSVCYSVFPAPVIIPILFSMSVGLMLTVKLRCR